MQLIKLIYLQHELIYHRYAHIVYEEIDAYIILHFYPKIYTWYEINLILPFEKYVPILIKDLVNPRTLIETTQSQARCYI